MGRQLRGAYKCLSSDCGSSDARRIYEDGTSFCFSCRDWFPAIQGEVPVEVKEEPKVSTETLSEIKTFQVRGFKDRLVTKEVAEFFDVRVSYDTNGLIEKHYYPYADGKGYKVRIVKNKEFYWVSKQDDLFGRDKFTGGGRRIVITEGEIDALSLSQINKDKYGKIYPVVALPSATATDLLVKHREWLRSFKEVIFALDMDEAGREATERGVKIIGLDKAKVAEFPLKDVNEVHRERGGDAVLECIFNSRPYVPSGIMTKDLLWEQIVNYRNTPSILFPPFMAGVNAKTRGFRHGEITLFTSGTSCGKSTNIREIALHMKEMPEFTGKIGIVSLEESPAETATKLTGMHLRRNFAVDEIPLEELQQGFEEVFGNDDFVILDHQGSIRDESIMDKLEYMALSGCQAILIDHITILVSEGAEGLTGNEAIDKVMNDLLRFVKRHNVWIGLVSHLRKTNNTSKPFEEGRMPTMDDIKGSGSIKQIAFDIIGFARNLMDPDPIKRNTIMYAVLKCRFTGLTGDAGGAYYDIKTGRFMDAEDVPVEEFSEI